jgi:hypothetical protein
MTHSFKLSRRIARFRAPLFAILILTLAACDSSDTLEPESGALADPLGQDVDVLAAEPALATRYAGGIPFGHFAQPTSAFGSTYNGAQRNIYPQYLLRELAAIKARGGKVMLMMADNERYYKDASGRFSLKMWKARVDRFRNVNINSYINDGTIIGHYLIDEPQDRANWAGTQVSQATLEEMAKYSKARWPGMATIVRTWPAYLAEYRGSYRYLDAAWAQYAANRFPNPSTFLSTNVSKAKAKGLALVVGLNISKGSPSKGRMSASQVKSYGSALLNSSYPCAFISWKYNSDHLSSGSMRDAMQTLRRKSENRGSKSCRG